MAILSTFVSNVKKKPPVLVVTHRLLMSHQEEQKNVLGVKKSFVWDVFTKEKKWSISVSQETRILDYSTKEEHYYFAVNVQLIMTKSNPHPPPRSSRLYWRVY